MIVFFTAFTTPWSDSMWLRGGRGHRKPRWLFRQRARCSGEALEDVSKELGRVHSRRESHKRLLVIKQVSTMNQNNQNSTFSRRILSTTFAILSVACPVISASGQVQGEPSAIDTHPPRNQVIATIPVGTQPFGIAVSPKSDFVYVSNSGANTISVISTGTNTVVATYSVPYAGRLVVSADGKELYVAGATIVSEVSTSNGNILQTFNVGMNPQGITISPNGKEVWVGCDNGIYVIDTVTQSVLPGVISAGISTLGVFSPNGKKFYSAPNQYGDVSLISTSSRRILKSTIGDDGNSSGTEAMALTPNGKRLYLGLNLTALFDVSTASYKLGKPIATDNFVNQHAFLQLEVTPNGKYLYSGLWILGTPEMQMFYTSTDKIYGAPIILYSGPPLGEVDNMYFAIAPDGNFLYVSHFDANAVYVLDIRPL